MEKIKTLRNRFVGLFTQTIWHTRRGERPAIQWLLIRLVRTVILSVQGFARHHGTLRASALTFYTLLSLVPVAAMAFGIAKGFGFERRLQQELLDQFAAQQEVVQQVIGFAQNMLDNTKGGMIAGIGVVVLFWAVIKVLGNIEKSFNHIWGVRSRAFIRKLSDYLTIMLICPVVVIMSGSVTVFITSQVSAISGRFELLQMVGPAIYVGLKLLPYTLIWVLFTLIYIIMPNTRVRFDGALLAGVIAGSAYQAVQAAYIHFQIIVVKYNAIYGSFAALPLFLLWLQISWFIVLIGAEISHAYQNSDYVDETAGGREMSISQTMLLALTICRHVVRLFHQERPAQTTTQIAEELALSPALVDNLSDLLVKGNILVRIDSDSTHANTLQPARDIGSLTVNTVVAALEDVGKNSRPLPHLPDVQPLSETLTVFRSELDRSAANRLIMDI
ncbi:MAG: YihY/virulence factor BrkB family protein [Desulfosarcina sp.]|nr:YihY/virulence factor BrkB family protein [Desulfosarcina sp.]MBC2743282.1 YihY/virulence factor BrkB family protein [Desulfosarcina sp.]MBC2766192.1 YihY/virulence factor BrkB family protein [Desulfosarcina sp.]